MKTTLYNWTSPLNPPTQGTPEPYSWMHTYQVTSGVIRPKDMKKHLDRYRDNQ